MTSPTSLSLSEPSIAQTRFFESWLSQSCIGNHDNSMVQGLNVMNIFAHNEKDGRLKWTRRNENTLKSAIDWINCFLSIYKLSCTTATKCVNYLHAGQSTSARCQSRLSRWKNRTHKTAISLRQSAHHYDQPSLLFWGIWATWPFMSMQRWQKGEWQRALTMKALKLRCRCYLSRGACFIDATRGAVVDNLSPSLWCVQQSSQRQLSTMADRSWCRVRSGEPPGQTPCDMAWP